jgi:hypothetical protein
MTNWSHDQAATIATPQEVRVGPRRSDCSVRAQTTIWIVHAGKRVFIRSTNGREAGWFRAAIATGTGQIIVGQETYDVVFRQVSHPGDLAAADQGYRAKYGQYPSIVAHLEEDGPRSATLEVTPG